MSSIRVCTLVAVLSVVAIGVVHLRAEQTRSAARTLRLEAHRLALQRKLWTLEARTARHRAPQRLHERIENLHPDLLPPVANPSDRSATRLVADRS